MCFTAESNITRLEKHVEAVKRSLARMPHGYARQMAKWIGLHELVAFVAPQVCSMSQGYTRPRTLSHPSHSCTFDEMCSSQMNAKLAGGPSTQQTQYNSAKIAKAVDDSMKSEESAIISEDKLPDKTHTGISQSLFMKHLLLNNARRQARDIAGRTKSRWPRNSGR